ncbi:MAG: lipopolysaccharide transport system ATP-binding protein [Roseivirga sp.]|jgi:lipopolysaccharide transport system ATP-binding protein
MKPIVEVKGLWKEYRRGAQKEKYLSLRDNVFSTFKPSKKKESFWALEDINFEVFPGDSLAIIGKNGAGKSTLLKILSKITPPTKGEITLRGRLASLLEVGTGFHPELTGRENIYLNGSILGLGRSEINRQFDAIVEFSGVEAFLDTPLKHYSSGMQLRLAFAVAAHLEPEILVIDEVLAVGDSAFQQKCIDKMTEVSQSGRTILFVSHNMQAINNLCKKGVLLQEGKLMLKGSIEEIISGYTSGGTSYGRTIDLTQITDRRGAQVLRFRELELNKESYRSGESAEIRLNLISTGADKFLDLDFGLAVQDSLNTTIFHLSNRFLSFKVDRHEKNATYLFRFAQSLKPGSYNLVLFIRANDTVEDWLTLNNALKIEDGNIYNFNNSESISGVVQPEFEFKVE